MAAAVAAASVPEHNAYGKDWRQYKVNDESETGSRVEVSRSFRSFCAAVRDTILVCVDLLVSWARVHSDRGGGGATVP